MQLSVRWKRIPQRLLLAAVLPFFGLTLLGIEECGDGEPDPTPVGSTFVPVDVIAYDYGFDLATGNAVSKVTLKLRDQGNCIALDYRLPESAAPLLNGVAPTWYTIGNEQLQLCGSTWPAGTQWTVELSSVVPQKTYGGTDIGYSVQKDTTGNTHYYLVSWVEGCSYFGPCYDDPNDFAHVTFRVSHPTGVQVLCPGNVVAGTNQTTCTFTLDGGPTYSTFGFAASDGWSFSTLGSTSSGIKVDLYDTQGLLAKVDEPNFLAFFNWIEAQLGTFAYGKNVRFFVGPYYWWGFEHPGNIALADSLIRATGSYQDPVLHVMMHELAHQWAGDQTTIETALDFVWKEAMAEYLTFSYESQFLPATYASRTLAVWSSNSVGVQYYPVPADGVEPIDFYGDVYGPGPMILFRQLEGLFGRDKVMLALQEVLGSPDFLTVLELQLALERSTGANLDEYFDEWVYGTGVPVWPTVNVSYADPEGDGTYAVTITQNQGNGVVYGFASTVRLKGSTQSQVLDVPFSYGANGTTATLNLNVKPGFVVTGFDVDPYVQALVSYSSRSGKAAADARALEQARDAGVESPRELPFEFRPF